MKMLSSIKTKSNKRNLSIILSVVALIEVILMLVSMSFAWFEGLTSLEMEGKNIPTASELKSEFIVGEGPDYEDTTAKLEQFFEAQANAKFSPVSSFDGEHFYALYEGNASYYSDYANNLNSLKFRELAREDINSNLVYFQFKVTAKDADVDFWLKEMPKIYINDSNTSLSDANNPFRFRIDDGTGKTASNEGNLILTTKSSNSGLKAVNAINANDVGTLSTGTLGNPAIYKVFNRTNNTNKNGQQVLFSVEKGETKTITVAIWLEALDPAFIKENIPLGAKVKLDIKFCSSWDVVDEITFRDYTSMQWINNTNNKVLGAVNLDSQKDMQYWYSGFTYDATNHVWKCQIPRAVQKLKFIWQTKDDANDTTNNWEATERGTRTTYTAFGKGTGLWYDGDVVKIGLSDFTKDRWLINQSPKMRVNIKYSGYDFNYSMTDSPSQLEGANTWYCYIPADLDEVRFNRCFQESDGTYTIKNYWIGPGRGTETIYYALESGVEVDVPKPTGTTVYLRVPADFADEFFDQNLKPAVSVMSQTNKELIEKLGNNRQNLAQTGGYVVDGSSHADDWYGDEGRMERVDTGYSDEYLYYFHFDFELTENTYLTFWNKPQGATNPYFNLDNRTAIAPYAKYTTATNVFLLTNPKQLTNGDFQNAWIFDGTWLYEDIDGEYGSGSTTEQPEYQTGRWGKPTKPDGTYTSFFVPPAGTTPTTVTATFMYEDQTDHLIFPYSVQLTKNNNGTFSTNGIPDNGVTNLKFTDGTNTWDASTGRTSINKYFVCTSTTAGSWRDSATIPTKRIYLVPDVWNSTGSPAFWVHAWIDGTGSETDVKMTEDPNESGVFYADIPETATHVIFTRVKPSSTSIPWDTADLWNRTDNQQIPTGKDTFTITGWGASGQNSPGTWDPVVPEPEPEEGVLYLVPNSNWNIDNARFAAYFFDGAAETWVSMTKVGSSNLYKVKIPDGGHKQVIFCRMNPSATANNWDNKWNQTADLQIPTDGTNTYTVKSGTWDKGGGAWSTTIEQ